MTHLLQYFPQLSLRPENLPELRNLILQLAVEGKLTAEWRKANPDVEPASELLARIEAEKAELVRAKVIKKEKPLPKINESETDFGIPSSWKWARLGEFTSVIRGITFPASEKSKVKSEGKVQCLRTANIQAKIEWDDVLYIDEKYVKRTDQYLNKGDIVMSTANSKELVGKAAIAEDNFNIATFGGFLTVIRPFQIIPKYLHFYLRTNVARDTLIDSSSQTTNIANISNAKLKPLPVPLPPLPEQKAIVQTVDALLQELDQLQQRTETRLQLKTDYTTAALRRLTTAPAVGPAWEALAPHFRTFFDETGNVQSLRAAILQLAVQGKLTAQWRKAHPDVEPATGLLSRIQAEKAALVKAKKIKKEKPLPPVDMDEVPFGVPEGWVWCRLGEVCNNVSSGSTPPKPIFQESGIPYLKVYNIRKQSVNFSYKEQFVNEEFHKTKLKRSILSPGDVIMNIVGPPLGKVAIIPDDYPEWNCNQAIAFFRPIEKSLNQWIYTFLSSKLFLKDMELIGTAGQDNISVTKSKNIIFPLPPLTEQHAIVQAVEELLGLCTALEEAAGRRDVVLGDWVRAVVAGV